MLAAYAYTEGYENLISWTCTGDHYIREWSTRLETKCVHHRLRQALKQATNQPPHHGTFGGTVILVFHRDKSLEPAQYQTLWEVLRRQRLTVGSGVFDSQLPSHKQGTSIFGPSTLHSVLPAMTHQFLGV